MGQLNIKSDKADALVSRLVELTGESKTQAVVTALEERLARMEQAAGATPGRHPEYEKRLAFMEALAARVTAATPPHLRTSDHADLYDENGLPR